jgi:murein DD-endopeptidase MepM/ murein hydrolase activator NlpD
MKKTLILSCIFISFLQLISLSQNSILENQVSGGEYTSPKNDANNPCISAAEYEILNKQCVENIKALGLDKKQKKAPLTTSLNWPLKAITGFNDCGFHFIGAYVDQNTATTSINDFDCLTNTYDGHHGTDIAVFPYGFYKMDNNQVEVVAAAAGTIVQKADGNYDRNCTSNSLTANSIIIQHADGSEALYWHMKKNSVTSKAVGQTVAVGEYLGVVGSSGSSSGPHCHFEIWSGSTNTTYKDPFSGTCNLLNVSSWWATQKPHTNPAILKVSVNTTDLVMPGCPTTETPNESDNYAIPFQGAGLAPGYAKFYIFLREIPAGATIDLKILNPNSTTFNSWTYTPSTFYKTSYWGFSKLLPTTAGTYVFQATYNGVTCSHNFNITTATGISSISETDKFMLFPNPTNNNITISAENIANGNYTFTLTDIAGKTLLKNSIRVENKQLQNNLSFSYLSKGIYFLQVIDENKNVVNKKIVLQ